MCWTDASGEARLIAAAIATPGQVWFCRAYVPDWIWNQLLPRADNQIGVQEALAVLLLVASFEGLLKGSLVTICVDNDGVSYSLLNGSSKSPEVNSFVAYFWLANAKLQLDSVFFRVTSKSNIADGPTRPDKVGCTLLQSLGAIERPALLPGYLVALWFPLANDVLAQDHIVVSAD